MGNIQFWGSKILFDSSKIAFDPACCCFDPQDCEDCGDMPAAGLWIDLPALTDNACADCEAMEGTHFLAGPWEGCWLQKWPSLACGFERIRIWYSLILGVCYLNADISKYSFPGGNAWWRVELTDYADPVDHVLSHHSGEESGGDLCWATGTTAHVYE